MTSPASGTQHAFAGGGTVYMEDAEEGSGVVPHTTGTVLRTDLGSGPSSTPCCLGDLGALEGDSALLSRSAPIYEGKLRVSQKVTV